MKAVPDTVGLTIISDNVSRGGANKVMKTAVKQTFWFQSDYQSKT